MARTTLDLDPTVLQALRQRGAREQKSTGARASELLAGALAETEEERDPVPLRWTSRDLGTPGVDLDDKEALRARLDESR